MPKYYVNLLLVSHYLAAPLTVPGRPLEVQGSVDHGVTEVNLHFLSAPRAPSVYVVVLEKELLFTAFHEIHI